MESLFEIMTLVREEILETTIIPGLGISWWKFSIYLLIIGVVVTVLINGVRVSSSKAARGSKNSSPRNDSSSEDD